MITPRATPTRAFTIIELLTIVVILGILAGITLPRLVGQTGRAASRELEGVEDFLTAAGTRESLTSAPLAIEYEDDTLTLVTLRAPEDFSPFSPPGTWVPDPLVEPVTLAHLELNTAAASGQTLDDDEWRISFSTIEARPAVALGLSDPEGNQWLVWLPPDSTRARTSKLTAGVRADDLRQTTVDLDAAGREDDPW